jgi:hypothetical protein
VTATTASGGTIGAPVVAGAGALIQAVAH